MRATIAGLPSPHPLSGLMPAVYQEDEFTMRWLDALDELLAPVFSSLDSLIGYVDPQIAPADFLHWLAGWFGALLDENWPLEQQREAVAAAVRLYRLRGTTAGLREQLELVTRGTVEIVDSGTVTASPMPTAAVGEASIPWVSIRVTVADTEAVSVSALEAIIRSSRPAHVPHALDVVAG